MLLGQNLSRPSFLFSLSARPSIDSPTVSLLPSFLCGPIAQLAFPARSLGSPAIAHPNRHQLLHGVRTEASGKFSPSHYLKRNQPNPS
jgi:hypothetical protein